MHKKQSEGIGSIIIAVIIDGLCVNSTGSIPLEVVHSYDTCVSFEICINKPPSNYSFLFICVNLNM